MTSQLKATFIEFIAVIMHGCLEMIALKGLENGLTPSKTSTSIYLIKVCTGRHHLSKVSNSKSLEMMATKHRAFYHM